MQLVPVSREEFATKAWRRPTTFAHAVQANILPVTLAELVMLVSALPLGFVETEGGFQLVAITALQPGTNLFIGPNGDWLGPYAPATIRTHPFYMVKPGDRPEAVLCFDVSSGLLTEPGQGETFFDGERPSPAVQKVLDFLSQTEQSRTATQRLVDALQSAALIQPWPLNVKQADDADSVAVQGLHRVDETALNALADDAFLSLRKTGVLPLVYAQLFSMHQLAQLPKAAEAQAKLKAEMQAQAAAMQAQIDRDRDPLLSLGDTFKFS
jgi:hypothetical protein